MRIDAATLDGILGEVEVRQRLERALWLVTGDRVGLVLLLAALTAFLTWWRIGVFITDTYAVANALVAVADGHLAVERATYGPGLATPGMHVVDGRAYARNYGQVVTALPFLWFLRGVTGFLPLSVAIAVGWSVLVLGLADQAGILLDRRRTARAVGGLVAVGFLVGNAALATPLPAAAVPLAALELQTMVAGALAAVVCYRLLARLQDRRSAAFAGFAVALATPLGFWASVPKRHALGTLALVTVVYAFARSRSAGTRDGALVGPLAFRTLAYGVVGLWAWVHAAEALLVLVVLLAADLPTAPANDPRTLATVAVAFALSLVPFLATNAAISGNPFVPPRLLDPLTGPLPRADGEAISRSLADGGSTGPTTPAGPATAAGAGGGAAGSPRSAAVGLAGPWLPEPLARLGRRLVAGVAVVVTQPDRVVATYLKSGASGRVGSELAEATNLALVESAPVVGGLVGGLAGATAAGAGRSDRSRAGLLARVRAAVDRLRTDPRRSTDALVAGLAVGYALFYQPSLPVHAQITVRYLVPILPLLVYGTVRTPAIRSCLAAESRTAFRSWALGVFLGLQVVADAVVLADLVRAEAMQLHAWLSLGTAALLAGAALARPAHESDRAVAVALGLAAAAGSTFLVLAGLDYYDYAGTYALPVVRAAAGAVRLV